MSSHIYVHFVNILIVCYLGVFCKFLRIQFIYMWIYGLWSTFFEQPFLEINDWLIARPIDWFIDWLIDWFMKDYCSPISSFFLFSISRFIMGRTIEDERSDLTAFFLLWCWLLLNYSLMKSYVWAVINIQYWVVYYGLDIVIKRYGDIF